MDGTWPWSWYNHQASYTDNAYEMINSIPGRVGPPMEPLKLDVVPYFREWIESDGYPLANFWEHTQGWWDARHLPNVLLVHFNKLKADLSGEMKRVANFLDIEVASRNWPSLVEHCTFDYMRKNASTLAPYLDMVFKGGGDSFMYKGTNGRWRDLLTAEDIAAYQRVVARKLSPECASWLKTGKCRDGNSDYSLAEEDQRIAQCFVRLDSLERIQVPR
jgi:aryl sulfotransferase